MWFVKLLGGVQRCSRIRTSDSTLSGPGFPQLCPWWEVQPAESLCREKEGLGHIEQSSWSWDLHPGGWCSWTWVGLLCPSLKSGLGWGKWRGEEREKGAEKSVRWLLPYSWQEMMRSEIVEAWRRREAWDALKVQTVPDWWQWVRKT